MAEELFKNTAAPKKEAAKSEPSGNPAVPGEQPNQPKVEPDANQTGSGPTNVTPPMTKEQGKGDPAQTTQSPEDGKQAPSSSGSVEGVQQASDEEDDLVKPDHLTMLKKRADLMSVKYPNDITLEDLKVLVQNAMEGKKEPKAETAASASPLAETPVKKTAKVMSLRQHLQQEKLKLVRVRITNLDPKKKDLQGEIITVANKYIGTIRKFVPFGEVTDNGYHIPQIIYDLLKERTFVSIKTRKGPKGEQLVEHQNAREFSLEVLPQLDVDQLAKLGAAQSAAGGL